MHIRSRFVHSDWDIRGYYEKSGTVGVLTLSPKEASSELYAKLCNKDGDGRCQFQSEIVLDENLPCDPYSNECAINDAFVVAVGPPGLTEIDLSLIHI